MHNDIYNNYAYVCLTDQAVHKEVGEARHVHDLNLRGVGEHGPEADWREWTVGRPGLPHWLLPKSLRCALHTQCWYVIYICSRIDFIVSIIPGNLFLGNIRETGSIVGIFI